MKKNYLMLVCLMLFMAVNATAQSLSVTDLFGNYKFTATVEFASESYRNSYGSILLGESDVTIEADEQYAGRIIGFAGSQQKLNIRAIEGNTVEMTNFNNPQLWNNLYMANGNAEHPNGVFENGAWVSYPYNTEYYEYNPGTKVITVPAFTVVEVSGQSVTKVATFKNAKLTYVGGGESEEPETPSFDWTGTYTFNGTPNTMDGSEFPSTFDVVVEYVEATEYQEAGYLVTSFMGNDVAILNYDGGVRLTVAEDGKSATLANGNVHSLGGGFFLKLFDVNATENPIAVTLKEDGTLAMANFSVVSGEYGKSEGNTMVGWYENVTLVKAGTGGGSDSAEFNWVGQHTVKAGKIESYDGKEYSSEFTMTVVQGDGVLLVTEFMGNDVNGINYGGIPFVVAADGMSAEMTAGMLVGGAYPSYLKLYDMNGTTSPVQFRANADATIAIADFLVKNLDYTTGEEANAVFYQSLVATKCPTGIDNVTVEGSAVKGIFDMQGRKVEQITAPGLYIVNGKKFLVK